MNERIKELVVQAGFSETYGLQEKERLSKFAELIVRECIIATGNCAGTGDMIKEHFGIEE